MNDLQKKEIMEIKKGMIALIIQKNHHNYRDMLSDCNCDYELNSDKAEAEIISLFESLVPETKLQILSTKNLEYEAGIIEGRNQLRAELNSKIKELRGE